MSKILVAIISNKHGFDKLNGNPLYEPFEFKHCEFAQDLNAFEAEFGVIINNPGMRNEGVTDELRNRGLFIWNKAYLYEFAKEIEAYNKEQSE